MRAALQAAGGRGEGSSEARKRSEAAVKHRDHSSLVAQTTQFCLSSFRKIGRTPPPPKKTQRDEQV